MNRLRSDLAGLIQPADVPGVIYELKPPRRWQFQGVLTQTNEHGFRGAEWSEVKGESTLRVVGIGDSVMFGWGVDKAATYMALLERLLKVPGRTVEVLNCAVPGYNSSQKVATLERRCLCFEPNVILIGYCTNDWAGSGADWAWLFLPGASRAVPWKPGADQGSPPPGRKNVTQGRTEGAWSGSPILRASKEHPKHQLIPRARHPVPRRE